MENGSPLLSVEQLKVVFELDEGTVRAVEDVSFTVSRKQIVGIIGESGCGKSVTAQAIMRIVPSAGRIAEGRIMFRSRQSDDRPMDLAALKADSREARQIRGGEICMIFQEPMTAFSPVHTIGSQITEAVRLHRNVSKQEARDIAVEMLERAGIPHARSRLDAYPFQLSGGLRQRCMIAMALCTNPRMVIADEPTTALDVTIQAQILDLMKELRDEFEMAILLITHDLGVVAETCEFVYVMYMGRVVESGTVDQIFHNPLHPYTRALLGSMPQLTGPVSDRLTVISGSVPDPYAQLPGCAFHPRCDDAIAGTCDAGGPPVLIEIEPDHHVACHLHVGVPEDSA
jgi:peptide/nickel transport system ATP-binding protein